MTTGLDDRSGEIVCLTEFPSEVRPVKTCDAVRRWRAAAGFAALSVSTLGSGTLCADDQPAVAPRQEAVSIASADTQDANGVQRASDRVEHAAVLPVAPDDTATSDLATSSHSIDAGWAADAVFYQVFAERFCNGDPANDPTRESLEDPENVPSSWHISRWTSDWHERAGWEQEMDERSNRGRAVYQRRYGGDLQGIINRLDYLRELGINAIYLNPVFYARSLHKYDGSSFHHVDPYFGPDPAGDMAIIAGDTSEPSSWHWTAADKLFLTLVRRAHALGIRVVIDGVFNHTGRGFFAFEDIRRHQAASRYKDWYSIESFDDPATPRRVPVSRLGRIQVAAGVRRCCCWRRPPGRPQTICARRHCPLDGPRWRR